MNDPCIRGSTAVSVCVCVNVLQNIFFCQRPHHLSLWSSCEARLVRVISFPRHIILCSRNQDCFLLPLITYCVENLNAQNTLSLFLSHTHTSDFCHQFFAQNKIKKMNNIYNQHLRVCSVTLTLLFMIYDIIALWQMWACPRAVSFIYSMSLYIIYELFYYVSRAVINDAIKLCFSLLFWGKHLDRLLSFDINSLYY